MEMLMVLIFAMSLLNIQSCKAYLCLTWSAENDKVILRCKTDSLYFPVSFYSPTGEEVASCDIPFPKPLCHSLMPNINIEQEIQTQTTTLTYTGNIDSSINGEWKCKHGINLEGGTVNVTVLQVKDPLNEKEKNGNCLLLFSSTVLSFLGTIQLIWLVKVITGLTMFLSKSCKRNLAGMQSRELKKFNIAVFMGVSSCLSGLIGLPSLVASQCKDCSNVVGGSLFLIFGCVVAVLLNLLTDMFNYVQTNDPKWILKNYPKTRLSTKGSETEIIEISK